MWLSVAVSLTVSASSDAETVTVFAVLQSDVVKLRVLWLPFVPESVSTVTSVLSLATVTVTLPVGSLLSATV